MEAWVSHWFGWLQHAWGPAPAWVWIVTCLVLPALNEVINRAKWTQAQSIFQGVMRALVATPLGKIPVIGTVLSTMAQPPPPPKGPDQQQLLEVPKSEEPVPPSPLKKEGDQ